MYKISATHAKQKFSDALAAAESEPVQIERHGKVVALMVPANYASNEATERRLARIQQQKIEADRLIRHHRIALQLLTGGVERADHLIREASMVVDRWERESLCSKHFIDRWRELLSLSLGNLAQNMCEDMEGWGPALRQNSPWVGLG